MQNIKLIINGTQEILTKGVTLSAVIVYVLVSIAIYVLRSIGLYVMASKRQIKGKKLSFVPFLWVYVMAKLIGRAFFFQKEFKGFAVFACVVATLVGVINLVVNVLAYYPIIGYYMQGGDIIINLTEGAYIENTYLAYRFISGIYLKNNFLMPYTNILAVEKAIYALTTISEVLAIVSFIVTVFIYVFLFRKYWPRHYILATFLCLAFDVFGIVIFCLRKKEPVNYEEYVRANRVVFYAPNSQPNNQNRNDNHDAVNLGDPFDEFPDEREDVSEPFSEFDKKD